MRAKLKLPGASILLAFLFAAMTSTTPPAAGSSPSAADNAAVSFNEAASTLPRLRSLLIAIDGELIEERYFNGSNKIFQLSEHHPVEIMIFDSADVLKVPWEIVVKHSAANSAKRVLIRSESTRTSFLVFLNKKPGCSRRACKMTRSWMRPGPQPCC